MDKIDRSQTLKKVINHRIPFKVTREEAASKLADDILDELEARYPDFFNIDIPEGFVDEKVIKIPYDDPDQIAWVLDRVKELYMNCISQWESNREFNVSPEEVEARKNKYRTCFKIYDKLYQQLDDERVAKLKAEQEAKKKEERRALYEELKKEFEEK